MAQVQNDLRTQALECLRIRDPEQKVKQTQALYTHWQSGELELTHHQLDVPDVAGYPDKPELVAPRELPRRRNSAETGTATLIHAIAHIEFNAINLGWDAVARFPNLPEQFYDDWACVAYE